MQFLLIRGLIAGTVSAGDYDSDGDLDLFIGGRVTREYPLSPRSFILQNNNGVFSDVTAHVCPSLQKAGMITGSAWTDLDNDKLPDLIIAGEWMPVRFFKNVHGRLQELFRKHRSWGNGWNVAQSCSS